MTLSGADRAVHAKDVAALERLRARIRRLQLRAGMRLSRIRSKGSFAFDGTVSFSEFAEKRGFCAGEASILAAAVEAPALHADLLGGRTCPEKVASVGRVLRDPSLVRPDEDWAQLARELTAPELKSRVNQRLAEVKSGGPVMPLKAWLTPQAAEDFVRCRELTVREARRPLTEGETLGVVLRDYVVRHDPVEVAKRALEAGRVADATKPASLGRPGQPRRATPAAEKHAVVLRDGDRCAVEGCDERAFLENAHRVPHRSGGAAAASDLDRVCRPHHRAMDSGTLKAVGREDRRVLVDRSGTVVARFRTSLPPP